MQYVKCRVTGTQRRASYSSLRNSGRDSSTESWSCEFARSGKGELLEQNNGVLKMGVGRGRGGEEREKESERVHTQHA